MPPVDTARACSLDTSRTPEARSSAQAVGLRYVSDCVPGIRRVSGRGGFRYEREDGAPVADDDFDRIRVLAIPPAWTQVWICIDPDGHIQATGRDARGRKQYRYHARWREVRDGTKFDRMVTFGEALPALRSQVDADLRLRRPTRKRIVALLVALLDRTLIRIGNREYVRENDSLGLSTLRDDNACVDGAELRLTFRGKAGKERVVSMSDRRLARAVQRSRDLPGQDLFQYVDEEGTARTVGSGDVNEYLREVTGEDITSKDFRTWGGTLAVASLLARAEPREGPRAREHAVVEAIALAASLLGNTPAVARRSYVHPGVVSRYLEGGLAEAWERAAVDGSSGLRDEEARLLAVLHDLGT